MPGDLYVEADRFGEPLPIALCARSDVSRKKPGPSIRVENSVEILGEAETRFALFGIVGGRALRDDLKPAAE